MIEINESGIKVCAMATKACHEDGCHHAKPHEWCRECRQVKCNSAAKDRNRKVYCVDVTKPCLIPYEVKK